MLFIFLIQMGDGVSVYVKFFICIVVQKGLNKEFELQKFFNVCSFVLSIFFGYKSELNIRVDKEKVLLIYVIGKYLFYK